MLQGKENGTCVGRRDFIKTTTMAGVAATFPGVQSTGRNTPVSSTPPPGRKQKKLLCVSDNPESYGRLIETIQSIPGTDLLVTSIKVDYQKPDGIIRAVHEQTVDILLMCLPSFTFNFGSLYDSMGDLDIPVIVLTTNPGLILIDANLVASLRGNGADVTLALSQDQALERVKLVASPRILEDRRAVLYGKPFDSTSVPARNLTEDLVYQRTGVRVQYRPIEELAKLFREADEADARREMERWKKEAVEVIKVSDVTILAACRLYVVLRSIVEKENFAAVSIDCLDFTMNPNSVLPHPCLAFARLRDEGITAACEADVCSMVSSMFLEEITRKPSFMCNLMSVDTQNSKIVVSHCVAPLKLNGPDAASMRYRLHDYHGFGRGVVPEVEFPLGGEVITGGFSKDLKSFLLWPGRIQTQVLDTGQASSGGGPRLNVCSNTLDVTISDAHRFVQNIPGIHQIMISGRYTRAIDNALYGMHVRLVGPADFTPPAAG